MAIDDLLLKALNSDYSDLFLSSGKKVSYRFRGDMIHDEKEICSEEEICDFRKKILNPDQEEYFRKHGSIDVSYSLNGNRFRINFYSALAGTSMAVRPIRSGNVLTFKKLNLPENLEEICQKPRGLILLAGTTGCGKSTTMATMINYINNSRKAHILTLEDPIEFVHEDVQSFISQREINVDTTSFSAALRSALRENPDVIVVGELRDTESMQTAISAALTGHLVISTVHTADTILAVERIVNMFPETQREQIAIDLGLSLNAIVAQRLVPAANGAGMLPAVEILTGTPSVRKVISEMDYSALEEILHQNSGFGMMKFNQMLYQLYNEGKISKTAALEASTSKEEFNLMIKGMKSGVDTFKNRYGNNFGDLNENTIDMRRLLRTALAHNASDLHLSCGVSPTLRINGTLCKMELPPLTRFDIQRLLFSVLNQHQRIELERNKELDLALSVTLNKPNEPAQKPCRFRINAFYQRGSLGVVCRVVNTMIPAPEALNLPRQLVRMAYKQQGLVLITGPTGSGKSTTLASLINQINQNMPKHIITLEDPIEYVHDNVLSIIEQRELHADTLSFASALRFALRQDPDVIMVGEMRDKDTMAATLTAAETGHLVFATIHTNSAPQTIDRIVDSFPTDQQNQIRLQLSGVLLGVLSQRLIPRLDGVGRAAAFELMTGTPPILALIRDGKTHQLQSVMETSQKDGMCTLDKSLENLYLQGYISQDQAQAYRADYQQERFFS
ncbi:MAG: PilT/PilU family type 4a pilus ATPase [Lentisphaeria bacterium]|nr:PilT/PilU family type 4a pilus ATPase [Lentisphaeria bacterium]